MSGVTLQAPSFRGDGMEPIATPIELQKYGGLFVAYKAALFNPFTSSLNVFRHRTNSYTLNGTHFAWIRPVECTGLREVRCGAGRSAPLLGVFPFKYTIHRLQPLLQKGTSDIWAFPSAVELSWDNVLENDLSMRIPTKAELDALKRAVLDDKTAHFKRLLGEFDVPPPFDETYRAIELQGSPKETTNEQAPQALQNSPIKLAESESNSL
jgi:hypothetical protein